MPGRIQSNSITLQTKARDGETFEVRPTVGAVHAAPAGGTLSGCQFTFYRRSGGTMAPYACHWALYRRTGTAYSRFAYSSGKVTFYYLQSASVTSGGTMADAFVMYIADEQMSAASLASQAPADYLAKAEVLVVRQGDTGATGPSYYMAGRFRAGTEYVRSAEGTPIVFLEDTGSEVWNVALQCFGTYWRLKADTNLVDGVYHAPGDAASEYWAEAAGFGVTVSGASFADFSKNGAGVMAGDYFYSANGRIDGEELVDGQGADGNPVAGGNPPAYTRFMGDPTRQGGSFSWSGLAGPVQTDRAALQAVRLLRGVTLTVAISGSTAASGTRGCFALYQDGSVLAGPVYLDGSARTVTLSHTAAKSGYVTVEYYGSTLGTNVSFQATYEVSGHFYPNWWVDLRTGAMHGARDNFILQPDGSVTAAGGNLTIDAGGNVSLRGTIDARTFFRSTARVPVQDDLDGTALLEAAGGTLPAVLVLYTRGHSTTSGLVRTVTLPPAADWQGHELEIVAQARMYVGSNTADLYDEIHLATTNDECFNDPAGSRPLSNQASQGWAYVRQKSTTAAVSHAFNWACYRLRVLSTCFDGSWRWAVLGKDDAEINYYH